MRTKGFISVWAGLVFALYLHTQAHGQDYGTGFASETKFSDDDARVHRLASDIAYTLERAKLASLSTNAQGQVGMPPGLVRVYHETAIRKMQQLKGLLKANSALATKHVSLLNALERASELDSLRESQAAGVKESERGDDHWKERLRMLGSEVLPSIVSNRVKNAGAP